MDYKHSHEPFHRSLGSVFACSSQTYTPPPDEHRSVQDAIKRLLSRDWYAHLGEQRNARSRVPRVPHFPQFSLPSPAS